MALKVKCLTETKLPNLTLSHPRSVDTADFQALEAEPMLLRKCNG